MESLTKEDVGSSDKMKGKMYDGCRQMILDGSDRVFVETLVQVGRVQVRESQRIDPIMVPELISNKNSEKVRAHVISKTLVSMEIK